MRRLTWALFAGLLVVFAGLVSIQPLSTQPGPSYPSVACVVGDVLRLDFDEQPSSPQPLADPCLRVVTHERGPRANWTVPHALSAEHGEDCSGPPNAHPVSTYPALTFLCNNHMMSSIFGVEYGAIYFTPAGLLDWSSQGVFEFQVSTFAPSTRDWWDVSVTPYADHLSVPLLSDLSQGVDFQGWARNTIHVAIDNGEKSPRLKVARDGVRTDYPCAPGCPTLRQGIAPGTNEAAVRQTFRLTLTPSRVKFERLASNTATAVTYFDHAASIGATRGVVQVAHHSYDPLKDPDNQCQGTRCATLHWDAFKMQPAVPIQYAPGTPYQLLSAGQAQFPPAPAGAELHFVGLCRPSVNGVPATRRVFDGHPEHVSSWVALLAPGQSTASVTFGNDDWYTTNNGCRAHSFAVFSQEVPPSTATPTPTLTPTSTATPTATAPSPTATPTSTSTATSTPMPTSTATATIPAPTPTATVTPIPPPAPVCVLVKLKDDVVVWWVTIPCD